MKNIFLIMLLCITAPPRLSAQFKPYDTVLESSFVIDSLLITIRQVRIQSEFEDTILKKHGILSYFNLYFSKIGDTLYALFPRTYSSCPVRSELTGAWIINKEMVVVEVETEFARLETFSFYESMLLTGEPVMIWNTKRPVDLFVSL